MSPYTYNICIKLPSMRRNMKSRCRQMKEHFKSLYGNSVAIVMDDEQNPLQTLPPIHRFQIMTFLSMMWTTIFCTAIGAWYFYGELLVGHTLVLLGIFATAGVFRSAGQSPKTYRDYPRSDGSARYDDIWGG